MITFPKIESLFSGRICFMDLPVCLISIMTFTGGLNVQNRILAVLVMI